jgi:hypothetical protein
MKTQIRKLAIEAALTLALMLSAGAAAGQGGWVAAAILGTMGTMSCFRIILRLEELRPDV